MALAALIAAYHDSAEPSVLRATLPLAGRAVVERQARLAYAAGATRIVVLVERMPPGLAAALDRLRRERVPVEIARGAEEAAELVDPDDRLLLIADGAIADGSQLRRLAEGEGSAVLTVPDSLFGELYERIDGSSRWSGLAATDGAMLRDTAAMLRDWDLQSTLLRRVLQADARHLAADAPVAIVDSMDDIAVAERQILEGARTTEGGWAARMLAPLERGATFLVMGAPVRSAAAGYASAALIGLGAAAIGWGWLWTGFAALLLSTPLEGIALRLARLRMQPGARESWWRAVLSPLSGGALVALSYQLAATHGWGMILLAFVTLAFLIAASVETEGRSPRGSMMLAERIGMTWLMLPFAIFGAWHAGLAALLAYAAGTFFWVQREAHRKPPAPLQD
ncbi:MAG: hypothetical protein KF780_08860 [Sphingomonas sp.]|nr:hypothetical protein [Sphingomonas sp.]